jgi:hypothetical protein
MLYDPSHYVLQQLDYLDNIDIYTTGSGCPRQGCRVQPDRAPGGLFGLPALGRPGRAVPLARRRPGRFPAIFSKLAASMTSTAGPWSSGNAALKHPEDGAREGAAFVKDHIIRVTEQAFDDFAAGGTDEAANRKMLGIGG